jgi:hypothetical protein
MHGTPEWFKQFLQHQPTLREAQTEAREKAKQTVIVRPTLAKESERLTRAYIIEKKPGDKKVMKYLQNLIDEIVAENED